MTWLPEYNSSFKYWDGNTVCVVVFERTERPVRTIAGEDRYLYRCIIFDDAYRINREIIESTIEERPAEFVSRVFFIIHERYFND